MTAKFRQVKLLRRSFYYGRGANGYARQWLLLLVLLLGGLLLPERPLAAAAVVARQTDAALTAFGRHAVLPALLPGAEVAAPQLRPEPLSVPSAVLPTPGILGVRQVLGPALARPRSIQPVRCEAAARLTSEVPNGP